MRSTSSSAQPQRASLATCRTCSRSSSRRLRAERSAGPACAEPEFLNGYATFSRSVRMLRLDAARLALATAPATATRCVRPPAGPPGRGCADRSSRDPAGSGSSVSPRARRLVDYAGRTAVAVPIPPQAGRRVEQGRRWAGSSSASAETVLGSAASRLPSSLHAIRAGGDEPPDQTQRAPSLTTRRSLRACRSWPPEAGPPPRRIAVMHCCSTFVEATSRRAELVCDRLAAAPAHGTTERSSKRRLASVLLGRFAPPLGAFEARAPRPGAPRGWSTGVRRASTPASVRTSRAACHSSAIAAPCQPSRAQSRERPDFSAVPARGPASEPLDLDPGADSPWAGLLQLPRCGSARLPATATPVTSRPTRDATKPRSRSGCRRASDHAAPTRIIARIPPSGEPRDRSALLIRRCTMKNHCATPNSRTRGSRRR